MENKDEVLRDFLLNSASDMSSISDEPTIISLHDTIEVLEKRNPNWESDEFCQKVFAWKAAFFLNSHSDEVIKEKCPQLMDMCLEYREHQTINGKKLHHMFGMKALAYIMPDFAEPEFEGPFGSTPVQYCYFKIIADDPSEQKIADQMSALVNYSAKREVDQMSDDEKIAFARQFQEDLANDPESRKEYNQFLLLHRPVP